MVKFSDKFKNPIFGPFCTHFPNFGGKKKFPGKSGSSCTTSYEILAPCQNLEKIIDTIPRKHPGRQKARGTDRAYFIGPFPLPPGVKKGK